MLVADEVRDNILTIGMIIPSPNPKQRAMMLILLYPHFKSKLSPVLDDIKLLSYDRIVDLIVLRPPGIPKFIDFPNYTGCIQHDGVHLE